MCTKGSLRQFRRVLSPPGALVLIFFKVIVGQIHMKFHFFLLQPPPPLFENLGSAPAHGGYFAWVLFGSVQKVGTHGSMCAVFNLQDIFCLSVLFLLTNFVLCMNVLGRLPPWNTRHDSWVSKFVLKCTYLLVSPVIFPSFCVTLKHVIFMTEYW